MDPPAPPPAAPARWAVERRHREGGLWARQEWADEGVARDEAVDPAGSALGDLARLVDPRGRTRGVWVRGEAGLLDAGAPPPGFGSGVSDWVDAWEGPAASGPALVHFLPTLDPRRRVLAVAEGLAVLPPWDPRDALGRAPDVELVARAVDAARRWALGEAEADELRGALRTAEACRAALVRENPATDGAVAAARACARLLRLALDPGPRPETLAWQALDDVRFLLGEEAPGPLAARVRRWVPLPVGLLALVGEPTPLAPDL